jgi:hypothetical protein
MKRIVLFIAILFSFSSFAPPECGPGEKFCNGGCHPAADCRQGGPPPPGLVLPIDSNIYFLLAAGLGLGIYFLGFTGKKFPVSAYSPVK